MNALDRKNTGKRRFIKLGAIGGAAAVTELQGWTRPVIESAVLPAHAQTSATIVDIASELADFTTLVDLLGDYPDLISLLSGPGPFTVWAPTNAAFTAAAGDIGSPTAEQLRQVLAYHVTNGIVGAGSLPATSGSSTPNVTGGPVPAVNGQIFVIDYVLFPV